MVNLVATNLIGTTVLDIKNIWQEFSLLFLNYAPHFITQGLMRLLNGIAVQNCLWSVFLWT